MCKLNSKEMKIEPCKPLVSGRDRALYPQSNVDSGIVSLIGLDEASILFAKQVIK